MITCQHEWVKQCQIRYRHEPPSSYHFENAHYPLSERLGGTETVPLWYPDHIVQGVLQTFEYNHPCICPKKYKIERKVISEVYPEYLGLYEKAYVFCQKFAGKRGGDKAAELGLGALSEEYRNSQEYVLTRKLNGKRAGERAVKLKTGILDPEYRESSKFLQDSRAGGLNTGSQRWQSSVDGFISTASGVAKHNRNRGWDPKDKIRVS